MGTRDHMWGARVSDPGNNCSGCPVPLSAAQRSSAEHEARTTNAPAAAPAVSAFYERHPYRTPNIDRVANEGVAFTDYYAQQSCTAGRSAFITGQNPIRTGLTKVGMPGGTNGLHADDPTIAELLKPLGYATGQFGKNHLGDRDEHLPTVHGFDEFFGNLYHLNAEEEPEQPDYPKNPEFKKRFGPRGVLHCKADGKGGQTVVDTGPLTIKRMETIDDEVTERALRFIDERTRPASRSSSGTTPRRCTSAPTAPKSTRARAARATTTT